MNSNNIIYLARWKLTGGNDPVFWFSNQLSDRISAFRKRKVEKVVRCFACHIKTQFKHNEVPFSIIQILFILPSANVIDGATYTYKCRHRAYIFEHGHDIILCICVAFTAFIPVSFHVSSVVSLHSHEKRYSDRLITCNATIFVIVSASAAYTHAQ